MAAEACDDDDDNLWRRRRSRGWPTSCRSATGSIHLLLGHGGGKGEPAQLCGGDDGGGLRRRRRLVDKLPIRDGLRSFHLGARWRRGRARPAAWWRRLATTMTCGGGEGHVVGRQPANP
ncbi:Os01g0560100 [Oryza sativa Japonica Group]|uniref:Os01g0560100 protein n=1 Tax=Oryza sativa subsp. japonica TaxID=39947 RepID=A0A0P0V451_ORYSJ|nr:Os01g0560100 [Oryza sativa Japonica Group]